MTRVYNDRRNRAVMKLIERRRIPPKDVPAEMEKKGFILTYQNVRKIISLHRKIHNNSQDLAAK